MIGLVVVTHGRLADELVAATEHVMGAQDRMRAVCIGPEDDIEARRRDVREGVDEVDGGDGVIIITDMFGGTPSNIAISLLQRDRVEVLAGANLPMLITLADARRRACGLSAATEAARDAGRRYITVASRALNGERV